ncbi:hypothetical protein DQ238_21815 [Geodermatophilus sp. TF02-6]|uniref:hypothetical protein n=1 Tax=Geodermatophilus sp. TF02-6 TaxID=2250575 RepID=UPI000DE9ECD8|nr:hypothetical protein [Geodermatophilus sp. TF02-6]RBY74479.1 hypothetical protein DQ238_21815 [Geodermatophilus sp. TF02-6]
MPASALIAGSLGILGALILAAAGLVGHALDGDDGQYGDDPTVPALFVAALLSLAGAVLLLSRRGWLLLVVSSLPAAVVVGWLVFEAVRALAAGWGEDAVGLLGIGLHFAVSPLAACLALSPTTRRWVAARKAPRRGGPPVRPPAP